MTTKTTKWYGRPWRKECCWYDRVRELRNELAHDYPVSDKDVVELLNELFIKTEVLFGIYEKIKQAYLKS